MTSTLIEPTRGAALLPRRGFLRRGRGGTLLSSVAWRLVQVIPTVLIATFIIFLLQHLIPGDVATALAGDNATPQLIASIRKDLGLDQPLLLQYWTWLSHALRGDLGTSAITGQSVTSLMAQRLPATLALVAGAFIIMVLIGVPAGVLAALRRDTKIDQLLTGIATTGIAVPSFWLGMVLVLVFSLGLGWLPATGYVPLSQDPVNGLRSLVLPSIALGAVGAAEVCRQTRSSMIEVLSADSVRTLRAKGLSPRQIVWKHALKNAGLPIVTIVGLRISEVVGGAVVVETLFAIPGLGSLVTLSITQRDYSVVQGVVLLTTLLVMLVNLVVDLLYVAIDPRTTRRSR